VLWSLILIKMILTTAIAATPEITVYTYDSFSGKNSLGAFIRETSPGAIGVRTKFVTFGSAGEALNQISVEKEKTRADIVVGIDQNLVSRAKATGAFLNKPVDPGPIWIDDLHLDEEGTFLPFDYGYLAFIYDQTRTKQLPTSLEDFSQREVFRKKVVISDPRTSSLGLSFLAWSRSVFTRPAALEKFWRAFARDLVTVAPGWSAAYGLMLKKEADFALSYTTSPAYHIKEEKSDNFRAVIFPQGHFRQVEGLGVLKGSRNLEAAKKWVQYLLSETVQREVAEKQWMYPARKGVTWPESFRQLGPPPAALPPVKAETEDEKRLLLRRWTEWVASPAQ